MFSYNHPMNEIKIKCKPVNFQKLVTDLYQFRRWTDRSIGEAIGVSQTMIHNLRQDSSKQPLHRNGEALIKLHETAYKKFGRNDD